MAAFFMPLLSPLTLGLALLGVAIWRSFSAADYNDYPGYTCSARDGYVPDGFPADRLPPERAVVSTFHPNIAWSHEYELFPAGVRCAYWTRDEPRVTVVTHSPWAYTAWVYGLLALALAQAVRVVDPDALAPRRQLRASG